MELSRNTDDILSGMKSSAGERSACFSACSLALNFLPPSFEGAFFLIRSKEASQKRVEGLSPIDGRKAWLPNLNQESQNLKFCALPLSRPQQGLVCRLLKLFCSDCDSAAGSMAF
jgi:hypothetical protein